MRNRSTYVLIFAIFILNVQNSFSQGLPNTKIDIETKAEANNEKDNEIKKVFEITFVGEGNLQSSLTSGDKLSPNTGLGVTLNRWFEDESKIRQFSISLSISVANSFDTINAQLDNNLVSNQRDFGSFLLIPTNNKQSALLTSTFYFNRVNNKLAKVFSGASFTFLGARSIWHLNSIDYHMAAVQWKLGVFHDFVPDKYRYQNGYSIIVGANFGGRYLLGDINYKANETARDQFINTKSKSFYAFEMYAQIKLRNIIAEVNLPLFFNSDEVPGLTRSQLVTTIRFIGGFPLKIENKEPNDKAMQPNYSSFGI